MENTINKTKRSQHTNMYTAMFPGVVQIRKSIGYYICFWWFKFVFSGGLVIADLLKFLGWLGCLGGGFFSLTALL